MKIRKLIPLLITSALFLNCLAANSAKPVKTLAVAEKVLNKGLKEIDLGLYPGILLMHGMSELAFTANNDRLLDDAVVLFKKYESKEIKGRGSFICYETGGSGAAYLYFMGKAENLAHQVADGAERMMEQQKRSSDGIMIPPTKTENQVFIDMAFAVTPYLLYAGLAQNKKEYIDYAVFETMELFRILHDAETGLVHQGRDFQGNNVISEDNWSRGNGWGAFGLATLVRDLPGNHPQRAEVEELARKFFLSVLKYQDTNGLWHQEMTDPTSYVETSGSGLLLYGLGIMLEKNLIAGKYRKNLVKGLQGYLAYIEKDGSVNHTCIGCLCPGNGKKEDYKNRKWQVNDSHAFGPVVLAFTQAARLGIDQITPLKNQVSTSMAYVRAARGNDVAWENDRIAYRVFGPGVRNKVASGVDIWAKSVPYPILDKWYQLNDDGKNYHTDRGEGCDFYDMGKRSGCGGLALWKDGKPYAPESYDTFRIVKNNPEEIEFELEYNTWNAPGIKLTELKKITMVPGTNFFRVTSVVKSDRDQEVVIAIGLSAFGKPEVYRDVKRGTLSVWEQIDPSHGCLGTAVLINPGDFAGLKSSGGDEFILVKARTNVPFTYYAGAGWDKSGSFSQKNDWEKYVKEEAGKANFKD